MFIYIAGPLFNEMERAYQQKICDILEGLGHTTWLPQRDCELPSEPREDWARRVFDQNVEALERCGVVVANLNGMNEDSGTAWEVGYAFALGKRIIGLRDDMRGAESGLPLNIMLLASVEHLLAPEDLPAALA